MRELKPIKIGWRLWLPALVWLVVIPTAAPLAAPGMADHANLPLRGIAAVALVVNGEDEELSSYGLSRAGLVAEMSEHLRQAGIEVLTPEALPPRPDAALLSLRIRLMRAPYYFYLYNVKLSLRSKVSLAQDAGAYAMVETWSDGTVGALQPTDLPRLRDLSLQFIDHFIAEHALQDRN